VAALTIEGLCKGFEAHPVLCDLNLAVASGVCTAILGASGSGKTTLLRLICGFERADAGRIVLDGRTVVAPGRHEPPERRHIGYVAQEGALFPHLSVAQNVLFGLPWRQRRDTGRAEALLRSVGLPGAYVTRGPHQLSGGEQQRVALARALAPEPSLVLLDEPFSALDAALRHETRQAVAAALRAAGATALLVTHDQAEALSMGDQVAVLRAGRLVQVAQPTELYRNPVDAELARFMGDTILLTGSASGDSVRCALGTLSLVKRMPDAPVPDAQVPDSEVPDAEVDVLVRPEQVRLDPTSQLRAEVMAVTFYGPSASVKLRLVAGERQVVTAQVPGYAAPVVGIETGLIVDGAVTAWRRSR
jgi:iron(III) transport system ATP-binding protein